MEENPAAPFWEERRLTRDQHRGGVAVGLVPLTNQFEQTRILEGQ